MAHEGQQHQEQHDPAQQQGRLEPEGGLDRHVRLDGGCEGGPMQAPCQAQTGGRVFAAVAFAALGAACARLVIEGSQGVGHAVIVG